MAKKPTKTTSKDLDIFIDEVNRWIVFWGLSEWEIDIELKVLDGSYAQSDISIPAHQATISLNEEWPDDSKSEDVIRDSAFHEVCEVFLGPLGQMAEGNWCCNALVLEAERHMVIQRLRNCVYKRSEYVDE